MKPCTTCQEELSEDSFSWRIKAKGIRQPNCKRCAAATGRWYRAQRREILGVDGLAAYQKREYQKGREKQLLYHKEYYQKNKEQLKASSKRWYANNRAYASKQCKGRQLRNKFGLSMTDFEAMLAAQNHLCAICHKNGKLLVVDHCHTTGRVRGLLCSPCNSFLGRIHDSLDTLDAIKLYLVPAVAPLPQ